ncbi:MAG: YidB family protein [Bacteroidota bacterium]|nr:YidB family protein [Bacteroidota bacterium]
MGSIDEIGGMLFGKKLGAGGVESLMSAIGNMIGSGGGLSGLVDKFMERGFGDIVSSWIGIGPNMPVDGEQIQSMLGEREVRSIAEKAGMSPQEAANGLAVLLPKVVDSITPTGTIPEGTSLEGLLSGLKKSFGA